MTIHRRTLTIKARSTYEATQIAKQHLKSDELVEAIMETVPGRKSFLGVFGGRQGEYTANFILISAPNSPLAGMEPKPHVPAKHAAPQSVKLLTCDVCNLKARQDEGYALTTTQVTTSIRYWQSLLSG